MVFYTTKGHSYTVGKCGAGSKVTVKGPEGSHLFALKGFFGGDCAAPAVKMVWGTEKCEAEEPLPGAEVVPDEPVKMEVPAPTVEVGGGSGLCAGVLLVWFARPLGPPNGMQRGHDACRGQCAHDARHAEMTPPTQTRF